MSINDNGIMDDNHKSPADLEKAKNTVLHLARVAADIRTNIALLDAEIEALKRNMWRTEDEVSKCRDARFTNILASLRERVRGIEESQVDSRRQLKETTTEIKRIWRHIKTAQSSPEGGDCKTAQGN
ncbi:hypothetical protein PG997_012933 [Apiospora hydei]|uniref:Uncharacterized protein n=1 Tax=Apiospora hydei TaxID=1337664 RepID=A0ABR1V799_9PEZI